MTSYPESVTEVKRVCAASGFEFQTLDTVRKRVYRGVLSEHTIGSSDEVYVKINPIKRKPALARFSAIATDVGHPPCEIVETDDYVCLLMSPAAGRPLSHTLPIVFLPVVWKNKRQQYVSAFHQLGRQLGRLHAHTDEGTGPVLDERERQKALNKTKLIKNRVSDSTIQDIRAIFEQSADIQTQYAITYGDRSPHNIFFDGETVTQIDASCKINCIEYEHRGVILGVKLMARRLPYSSDFKGDELANAYWNGYERECETEKEDITYLVRHLFGALKVIDTYESPKTLESKLTQWTDVPILVDEIETTVAKIAKIREI